MKAIFKLLYFVAGFLLGYQIGGVFYSGDTPFTFLNSTITGDMARIIICSVCGVLLGIIFIFLIPAIARGFGKISKNWVSEIKKFSFIQLIFSMIGLIIGLLLAMLISNPLYRLTIPTLIKNIAVVLIYILCGYISLLIVSSKAAELESFFKNPVWSREREPKEERQKEEKQPKGKKKQTVFPKILDTSVIIDGRVFDIFKTGFIDGPIVIPTFVLEELQFVADSEDALKRNRGRRGLDVLNKIQKELPIEIVITEKNYSDVAEVDMKLLRLARDMNGKVVTNDYNLNRIAEFQGIPVLNTNDLANAVKTVVLPGEEMVVQIIKEGKEADQGIGYMEDGTMIVVESGHSLIGKSIHTTVMSVLQTSAGRMVFVKPLH